MKIKRKEDNIAKIGVIFLVSVMALAGASAGYALWSEDLTIDGTINTGTVDVEWQNIEAYDNQIDTKKDASSVTAIPDDNTLVVTLTDAYPCITYTVEFDLVCVGTIPVHFTGWDIDYGNCDPSWIIITDSIDYRQGGPQLHQDESVSGKLTIHLDNSAEQGAVYTFEMTAVAGQYNEYPPSADLLVTSDPSDGGIVTGSGTYYIGTYQPITATANTGYTFMGWIGDDIVDPTSPSTTVYIDGDKTVTAVFESSLVGYWKMDDGTGNIATDSSGNDNHGTLMPASPDWTSDGKINGALDFDGIDDYVEIPDDPTLDITDEITIMAWLYSESWDEDSYPSPDDTTENGIITKAGDEDWGVWNLHYKTTDEGFRFEVSLDGTGVSVFEETPSTSLNTWYHIAGVYDGSEIILYINGVPSDSAPATGLIDTNNEPLRFGKQFWWDDHYSMWDGKIDEVKIYSRALSDAEIQAEFDAGNPGTNTIMIDQPGGQYSSGQYGYDFDYSGADVQFTYMNSTKLKGTIHATGLKPYCTYQLKLLGKPTCSHPVDGDDTLNEYLGYHGRWTCVDCACSGSGCNRNDGEYEANKILDDTDPNKECIVGYLVFGFFTADASGNAVKYIEADNSYHVLWSGGGICGSNINLHLAALDGAHPTVLFSPPDKVNGQPERFGCGGLSIAPGVYDYGICITEECFHKPPMNWATVLLGDISFEII